MIIRVQVDSKEYQVDIVDIQARPVIALIEGEPYEVWPEPTGHMGLMTQQGAIAVQPSGSLSASPVVSLNGRAGFVYAPLPGIINAVHVNEGATISAGQIVCVLEAMKMKNSILAPRSGKVKGVYVRTGQVVHARDPLFQITD